MSARTNVATTSPANNKKYPIVLGKSFFQQSNPQRPTGFVSATYRFKPSSVDESRTGHITFDTKNATLQFDRKQQQAGNCNNSSGNPRSHIQFSGPSAMAQNREFFLWFDASNQRMVMEKCGVQIKHLSHSREVRQTAMTSYNDTSKDRLKQFEEKHKKKARAKSSKGQNKRKTNIKSLARSSNNNMDKRDSNRSQSRSMSKSISPLNNNRDLNNNQNNTNNNGNGNHQQANNSNNTHNGNNNSNGPHNAGTQRNTANAQYRNNNQHNIHMNAPPSHPHTNANVIPPASNNVNNNYEEEATAGNGPRSLFGNAAWADDSDSEDDDIL